MIIHDLNAAAALMVHEHKFLEVVLDRKTKKAWFQFEEGTDVRDCLDRYYMKDLLVPAKLFCDMRSILKARISDAKNS